MLLVVYIVTLVMHGHANANFNIVVYKPLSFILNMQPEDGFNVSRNV